MPTAGARVVRPKVTDITFVWNYPTGVGIDGFLLCITNVQTLTGEVIATGRSLSYRLLRTNWTEYGQRHWYSVRATRSVETSDPSSRIPWPPFEPDRMEITSSQPVMLQFNSALATNGWSDLGPAPQVVMLDQPNRFFRGKGSRAVLSVRTYNPLNQ